MATSKREAGRARSKQRLLGTASTGPTPAATLDDWLRKHFFAGHCRLFHHRPFVWHVWDGLPRRLLGAHQLPPPRRAGRRGPPHPRIPDLQLPRGLDRTPAGRGSATGTRPAPTPASPPPRSCKTQLKAILAGEPPLDIFIRWKPLPEQPIGWRPDLNDGVRLNIRPFLRAELRKGGRKGAGILRLRVRPNIKWAKDRGKEPQHLRPKHKGDKPHEYRPKADFPWFWSCPGDGSERDRTDFPGGSAFDGARWNDLHYTTAAKRAARERQFDHA